MTRKEELKRQIHEIEDKLLVLNKEYNEICRAEADIIAKRIDNAYKSKGDFTADELIFAAYSRCKCGAGMAYPENIGAYGEWSCSDILMGNIDDLSTSMEHTCLPFMYYDVKSENQPSAHGNTTRPENKQTNTN